MAASNYLRNKTVDHTLGTTSYTMPSTIYIALFTSDPGADGSGTEVSGGSYSRQTISFSAASGGVGTSSGDVTYTTATGSWGTITHAALYDASTSGNLLYYGALSASKTVASGDTFKFSSGNVTLTVT